jgi:hypothetical protein
MDVQLTMLTHGVGMASVFALSGVAAFFILESVREGDLGGPQAASYTTVRSGYERVPFSASNCSRRLQAREQIFEKRETPP